MRAQFVCILLTDLSIAIILGQEIGVLPIHDLYIRFHGGMDIELVEHHHLLVSGRIRLVVLLHDLILHLLYFIQKS